MKATRALLAPAVFLPLFVAHGALASSGDESWHRLIGILQYLEADYPAAVESQSAFEMAEQRAFIAEALEGARELGPKAAPTLGTLESLQRTIERGEDPEGVSRTTQGLIEELVKLGGVVRSPRHPPDLEAGRALFAAHCALCHAADGSGDVPAAAEMEPPPANFLDDEAMGSLSPYKAFNTTSFGVTGTAMPGFPSLSEDERWSLAFFVQSMRHESCEGKPPRLSVQELAMASDLGLAERYGAGAVPCLRRELPTVDPAQSLLLAQTGVREAVRLASAGDSTAARRKLVDVYLQGVEPVELMIQTRDKGLVQKIEQAFLAMRFDLEQGAADVSSQGEKLHLLLEEAKEQTSPASLSVAFWGAFVVILREGFEAMIVVAALLAVLKRMKQPVYAKFVHAGWASAMVLGAVGFVFGQRLLAGFNPEWVEGIAALLAVAMLLYHTVWLSARAHVSEYMKELRGKMESALGRGSVLALFAISFTAVLRESLEVILFLQGLAIDSPKGVAWGAAAGMSALLAMVLLVSRVGYKLPMKALFRASTIVLFATAVVLLGKGVHALQLVGAIPVWPTPLFTVDLLGIFPDVIGLGSQATLLLLPLVWTGLRRLGRRRAIAPAVSS